MHRTLLISVLAAISLIANVAAQAPDDDQLTLPDAVMKQVVSRILTWNFKPAGRPTTVLIGARGIKPGWFPASQNITFQLAPENDALKAKNGVFLFEGVQRIKKRFSINAGRGDFECDAFGATWEFKVGVNGNVRLWQPKGSFWGRGCGGNGPPNIKGLELGEVSPNELPGYEFFKEGKLKPIRLGISTKSDMRQIFGDTCESTCDYDGNWNIYADYYEDRVEFSRTTGDTKETQTETEYIPRPDFVDKLESITLSPKKRISFLNVAFPRTFGSSESYSIGDAWDMNGFAGAVHTTWTIHADGYGLKYSVFGAETFNNLVNKGPKVKDPIRKGDLGRIEYTVPDSLEDLIFASRPTAPKKS